MVAGAGVRPLVRAKKTKTSETDEKNRAGACRMGAMSARNNHCNANATCF